MLYNCLKIFHILSATLLLTSMGYSYHLWKTIQTPQDAAESFQRIQTQTWLVIVPIAILQLATGFTMLSLQEIDLSQPWISGSVIGFIILIGSWFSFIYFLTMSQQLTIHFQDNPHMLIMKYRFFRRLQSAMLSICALAVMTMVFFMANKAAVA